MVVGPHPLSNPANWARFSCQWLLRKTADRFNLTGSLSEADGRIGRKMRTQVQIRISRMNRRTHFIHHLAWGRKHDFMEYHQLIRKETRGHQTSGAKTTGSPLEHQRGQSGALAQRGHWPKVPQALRPCPLPAGRYRSLRRVVPVNIDKGPGCSG
jgi:hypothetical protein